MKKITALIVPLLSLLVAVGVCSAAPPPFPFLPAANKLLPGACTNGYTATYSTTTGLWACTAMSGSGDLKADGTVPLTAHWNVGAYNITASSFTGALTGNASTATALAADPANCAAGSIAVGVNASGVAECSTAPSLLALTLYGQSAGSGAQLMLGSSSGSTDPNNGKMGFRNSTNGYIFSVTTGVSGADLGWTLPTAAPGGANYLLNVDADGTMGYTDPASLGGGAMATDTLWDAAGDLAIGTGANTGGKLTKGAQGTVLQAGASTVAYTTYALPTSDCTENQILKANASGDFVCAADATGGTPTVITVADTTDTSSYVALFESATGDLGPKTDAGITYNAGTGILTATGFSGPHNGTVGATTPAAGTFTSITIAKSSGVAGDMGLYEANSTDTHAAGFRGPDSITGDGAYRIKFPDARAAGAGRVLAVTNAGESGAGTAADPYVQTGSWIVPLVADGALGTPSFTALNMPTSNSDPGTTAGQIKHDSSSTESQTTASGVLKWYDGANVRTIADIGTDSTIITKTEFLPIRYAEDGSAAPAAAAAVTGKVVIARSFADGKDVVFFWSVPADYVGAGDIKYRVHYALATDASADDTVTFTATGCAIANSADIACSAGTGLAISDELGTDDDQYQYMVTDYSAASNADWGIAAGGFAKLGFSYSDGDYDAAALVIGIEIKYKAKLVGLAGY